MEIHFRFTNTPDGIKIDSRSTDQPWGLTDGWSHYLTVRSVKDLQIFCGDEVAHRIFNAVEEGTL